jgi:signal transduction histidine kinase
VIARLPIRVRLSLLYGLTVFAVGALLMAAAYVIVQRNLTVYSHRVSSAVPHGRLPLPPPAGHRPSNDALAAFLRRETRRQRAVEHRARVHAGDSVAAEFLLALLALSLPAAALGYVIAGRVLRPVSRITETARRVGDGDLRERIALGGPDDELRRLADTFDVMLARLERTFLRQRSFVANASHELRTPLAIVRAELDATLDGAESPDELRQMARAIAAATSRSEQLVEGLLLLAQSEGASLARDPVELGALVCGALADLGLSPALDRIDLRLSDAEVCGDPTLLSIVTRNLVDNAARYRSPDGWITITTSQPGDAALLVVENDGSPIPAALIPTLAEPFSRLEPRHGSGVGLGLAIAKAICEAHGGTIAIRSRSTGGLSVEVRLPRGDRHSSQASEATPAMEPAT